MFCTVYGELCKDKVKTDTEIYQLIKHSQVFEPIIGWFQLCKVNDKWILTRVFREALADVLPNWQNE